MDGCRLDLNKERGANALNQVSVYGYINIWRYNTDLSRPIDMDTDVYGCLQLLDLAISGKSNKEKGANALGPSVSIHIYISIGG